MKKTLTIILLSISLSGFSQTGKGDFVIGIHPYIFQQKLDDNNKYFRLGANAQYYLSNQLSVGTLLRGGYQSINPVVSSEFYRSFSFLTLSPELQYNFLRTRLAPFIKLSMAGIGYFSHFEDNPSQSVNLRRNNEIELYYRDVNGSVGLSYFAKKRFVLQVTFDILSNERRPFSLGMSGIFIINNPR
jgi:hypothetical protein